MTKTTRRRLLAGIGGAATVAVAGCSGSPGSGGNSADGGSASSVITGTEIVESDEISGRYNLAVDLVEDHGIDQLSLQNPDGTVRNDTSVNAEQTRVELFAFGGLDDDYLVPSTYPIIAYDGESVVARQDWSAEADLSVEDVAVPEGRTEIYLDITVRNDGVAATRLTDGYLTNGFPVEESESSQVGVASARGGQQQIAPLGETTSIIISHEDGYLLAPENQSCSDREEQIEATLNFESTESISIQADITLGGDYVDFASDVGCSDLTVTDWETV